jgi:ferric-dicitrate binding protein FerR (iron transport regulator)
MDDLLLISFIEGKTTKEDAIKVLNWIEESGKNKKYFAKLHTIWTAAEICKDQNDDVAAIKQIIKKAHKKNNLIRIYRYVAAACITIAIVEMGVQQWNTKPDIPDYEAAIKNISQSKEITLKISQEKEIQLTDSIPIVSYNNKRIIINDSIDVTEKNTEILNTIHIPYGKRSKLILADGTTVHLNAGSTLVYPSEFNKKKREVYLDGEAYFEVEPGEGYPFIVQTTYRAIEVYGTKFNVSVDRDLQLFETTLVCGSVGIKSKDTHEKLTPNQCYSYSDNTKREEIKEVDVNNYILWTEGKLQFEKEALYKAIRKVEKIYNIKITLTDNKYLNFKVSGHLNLNDSAEKTVWNLISTVHTKKDTEEQAFYHITYNNK